MALGSWTVGVFLNFTGNGAVTMQRLASQTSLANAQLMRQQGLIDKNALAMQRYTASVNEHATAMLRLRTRAMAGAAISGLAVMGFGVGEAAKLQMTMIGVKNATGASATQMERLRQAAFDLGDQTGVSVNQAAKLMAIIARASGGLFTTGHTFHIAKFLDMLPRIGNYAMLQHYIRGTSYESAAESGVKLAHLFGAYYGKKADAAFDLFTRLSESMPDTMAKAATQFAYFEPQLRPLGVDAMTSVGLMALLSRYGMGSGKGGTSVAALFRQAMAPLQLTTHAQKVKLQYLEQMGLVDSRGHSLFFTDKKADALGFLDQLALYAHHVGRSRASQVFNSVFGSRGSRLSNLTQDSQFLSMLSLIRQFMSRSDISQANQAGLVHQGLLFQAGRAWADFTSLFAELAHPWLDSLTALSKGIGDALHGAQAWLHRHHAIEKGVGEIVATFTGLSSLGAAIGGLTLLSRGLGVLGLISSGTAGLAGFLRILDLVFAGGMIGRLMQFGRVLTLFALMNPEITGIAIAIAALGTGIYETIHHWPQITSEFKSWSNSFVNAVGGFLKALGLLSPHTSAKPAKHLQWYMDPQSGMMLPVPTNSAHHTTIHNTFNVYDATDPKKVVKAIDNHLRHPMHGMYSADSKTRTHAFIPRPLSTPPAFAI